MRHIKAIILINLGLVLAGCTSVPQQPVIQIQKVEVPVPVACKTESPPQPNLCLPTLNGTEDIFTSVKCLLSDIEQHKAYETQLDAALRSCK